MEQESSRRIKITLLGFASSPQPMRWFKADFVLKLWLTLPVAASLFLATLSFSGVNVHWKGTLSGAVFAGLTLATVFFILRLMNRPGSRLVEPLEQAILLAISGRRIEPLPSRRP